MKFDSINIYIESLSRTNQIRFYTNPEILEPTSDNDRYYKEDALRIRYYEDGFLGNPVGDEVEAQKELLNSMTEWRRKLDLIRDFHRRNNSINDFFRPFNRPGVYSLSTLDKKRKFNTKDVTKLASYIMDGYNRDKSSGPNFFAYLAQYLVKFSRQFKVSGMGRHLNVRISWHDDKYWDKLDEEINRFRDSYNFLLTKNEEARDIIAEEFLGSLCTALWDSGLYFTDDAVNLKASLIKEYNAIVKKFWADRKAEREAKKIPETPGIYREKSREQQNHDDTITELYAELAANRAHEEYVKKVTDNWS